MRRSDSWESAPGGRDGPADRVPSPSFGSGGSWGGRQSSPLSVARGRGDPFRETIRLILGEESRLRRVARRLTRCDADADDLVQDTLLRAFRARDRFQPGTSIAAWTLTILRRVFLTDANRARRRRLANDTDAGEPLGVATGILEPSWREAEPNPTALAEHLDESVKRALDRLSDRYREPLLLSAIDGLQCKEIAGRLRIPTGTVMSRIHRAREQIRRDLVGRATPRGIRSRLETVR